MVFAGKILEAADFMANKDADDEGRSSQGAIRAILYLHAVHLLLEWARGQVSSLRKRPPKKASKPTK